MRTTRLALLLVAACSGGSDTKKDGGVRDTMDQPSADAPPLIACTPTSGNTISFHKLGDVSGTAVLATSPPNDGRLFVIEEAGRIRIFENGQLRPEPFLDISNLPGFAAGGEQGLLGLAFHPNYNVNRQFFVFYTTNKANVVARYYVSQTDYDKADPTGDVLLTIPDFATNHNGGMMEFGPTDHYLYISTGDGGGGGNPCGNSQEVSRTSSTCQNPGSSCAGDLADPSVCEPLLGKILRIDVDTTTGLKKYGIPADNPYADGTQGEPEIFIRGLRNPWRWSFDRMTGDMYIGDVGQEIWEEVDVLTPAEQKGANMGWSLCEGDKAYDHTSNPPPCTASGVVAPKFTRNQGADNWMAVVGGQVYRGPCYPDLAGSYFFTDYIAHELMRGTFNNGTLTATMVATTPNNPSSLHADARGELFLTTTDGAVYQIEAGP